jgi:hypothetical protein
MRRNGWGPPTRTAAASSEEGDGKAAAADGLSASTDGHRKDGTGGHGGSRSSSSVGAGGPAGPLAWPEPDACGALGHLSAAARHALWLSSEDPSDVAPVAVPKALAAFGEAGEAVMGAAALPVDDHDEGVGPLTSLYGLLQAALLAYDAPPPPPPPLDASGVRLHSPENEAAAATANLGEALRRFEALAMVGEPQAALNAAFLYRRAAEGLIGRGSGGGGGGSGGGGGFASYAAWAWHGAATAAASALPAAVAEALGLAPFCAAPSDPGGQGDARRLAWLRRAVALYAQAASEGSAEAKRELGHCHWGLGKEWEGVCAEQRDQASGSDFGAVAVTAAGAGAKRAAELFEEAAAGGDLQAMRALAHLRSGLSAPGAVSGEDSIAGGGAAVNRTESRQLFADCASAGGYPDGLPCQLEALAAEARWAASDLAAAATAAVAWARG